MLILSSVSLVAEDLNVCRNVVLTIGISHIISPKDDHCHVVTDACPPGLGEAKQQYILLQKKTYGTQT